LALKQLITDIRIAQNSTGTEVYRTARAFETGSLETVSSSGEAANFRFLSGQRVAARLPAHSNVVERALLAALIERIEVRANRIDIQLRPTRLSALLDIAATPAPSETDGETQILSGPIRLRRPGREIKMLIDGADAFATAKPDARLIKLLIRARRFNAMLNRQRRCAVYGTGQARGREPLLFHAARGSEFARSGEARSACRRGSRSRFGDPSHGWNAASPTCSARAVRYQ